jgi:hypothetical protein
VFNKRLLILEFKWIGFSTHWATRCSCFVSKSLIKIINLNRNVRTNGLGTLNSPCKLWPLLCLDLSLQNISQLRRLAIWTFVHVWPPLHRDGRLSFVLVRTFDKRSHCGISFVILLLLLLLTYRVFESANRVELANGILVQLIDTFESTLANGFLMVG